MFSKCFAFKTLLSADVDIICHSFLFSFVGSKKFIEPQRFWLSTMYLVLLQAANASGVSS